MSTFSAFEREVDLKMKAQARIVELEADVLVGNELAEEYLETAGAQAIYIDNLEEILRDEGLDSKLPERGTPGAPIEAFKTARKYRVWGHEMTVKAQAKEIASLKSSLELSGGSIEYEKNRTSHMSAMQGILQADLNKTKEKLIKSNQDLEELLRQLERAESRIEDLSGTCQQQGQKLADAELAHGANMTTISELQHQNVHLEACMSQAGIAAFMKDREPEEIGDHLREVLQSYADRITELEGLMHADPAGLGGNIRCLMDSHADKVSELMTALIAGHDIRQNTIERITRTLKAERGWNDPLWAVGRIKADLRKLDDLQAQQPLHFVQKVTPSEASDMHGQVLAHRARLEDVCEILASDMDAEVQIVAITALLSISVESAP